MLLPRTTSTTRRRSTFAPKRSVARWSVRLDWRSSKSFPWLRTRPDPGGVATDHPRDELLLDRSRLALLSGFTEAEVAECETAGVIHATDDGYRGIELVKLQILRQVAEQHGGLERVLQKYKEGGYSLNLLEIALPVAQQLSNLTYSQLYEKLGIPTDEIHSVMRAAGLPLPDPDQPARVDEVEAFEQYAIIRILPIPAEARLHALRVTGESLRRAAEVQSQLFREHVVHPLLERFKDDPQEANTLISEISSRAHPTVTAVTGWLFPRYLEHQTIKNATELMEEAVGDGVGAHRAGDPTVAFVDLVGFTVLSADLGDRDAADLAGKVNDMLMDLSLDHARRVLKTMSDAAILSFDRPSGAVKAGFDLLEKLPAAGLPPLRVGIHR